MYIYIITHTYIHQIYRSAKVPPGPSPVFDANPPSHLTQKSHHREVTVPTGNVHGAPPKPARVTWKNQGENMGKSEEFSPKSHGNLELLGKNPALTAPPR